MSVSTQYIVRSVIESIEAEVLPHLEPQARPASHLRACLMMLANVETRIEHEARNLFDDNRELRGLLRDAAAAGLDGDAAQLLATYPEREYFDFEAAAQENREYQETVTRIIKHGKAKGDFRTKLHCYLEALDKRDRQLVEAALSHVPL